MKRYTLVVLTLIALYFPSLTLFAQAHFTSTGFLPAKWIQPADQTSMRAYGVFHFRKSLILTAQPTHFIVHVSGDNRYRFFVNGQEIGIGPARGDTQHWYYDTYDIAPHLKPGKNVLAAQVWNMADQSPVAQMSYATGFLLQGDSTAEAIANTNSSWQVYHNPAYQPVDNGIQKLSTYIVIGPGDLVDGNTYPWNWQQPDFDDTKWPQAKEFLFPTKLRHYGTDGNWALMPRSIPPLWSCPERLKRVRRTTGSVVMPSGFLSGEAAVTIGPNQKVSILLDQEQLTNGYPELTVSGGKNAHIRLSYAEGMMDANRQKMHRDSINGLQLIGFSDEFIADGGSNRLFRPLWFRTWRYMQLDIETGKEALTINDLHSIFSGYPLKENAAFHSNDSTLTKIWDVGWRTARLCAMESYFDCPYYEQLQYTGDTRIQSLISLYVSGDDRLMRKAIQDFADSRNSEGLTQSRYPCNDPQVIPPFSLFWVSMVHDYWMLRSDDAFVQQQFDIIQSVLTWHEKRLAADGMNGALDWWNFVDWAWQWDESERIGGVPPGRKGGSAILSLQFAYTLDQAADLFGAYGLKTDADKYRTLAQKVKKSVYAKCWDNGRGLLADTPEKKTYSQHANIWGVLTDAIPVSEQVAVMQRVMSEKDLTQATLYFRFYLFECLKKTGLGDQFLPQLAPWHQMIRNGLTTFAEQADPTRSDCHAWSASPNYQLLSLVCGIQPATPGFEQVKIEPFMGTLPFVEGRMPHPKGEIKVVFSQKDGGIVGLINLPAGVSGQFRWKGRSVALVPGENKVGE